MWRHWGFEDLLICAYGADVCGCSLNGVCSIFIGMTSTLHSLGQSLEHWQVLYIVAICAALLSTFAMVYYAFHRDHPKALRTSNYVYAATSFLSVLATMVIVVKTRSLDMEKDRLLKITSDQNDLKLAEAGQNAAESLQQAVTAQLAIEALKPAVGTLQTDLGKTSKTVGKLTTARTLRAGVEAKRRLIEFEGAHLLISADESDPDAMSVYRQLGEVFRNYSPQPTYFAVLGMPIVPMLFVQSGIHIRHENSPIADGVAASLAAMLHASSIAFDSSVPTGDELSSLEVGHHWPDGTDKVLIVICRRN